jgi:biofilm PGA synthesis protein PgaA
MPIQDIRRGRHSSGHRRWWPFAPLLVSSALLGADPVVGPFQKAGEVVGQPVATAAAGEAHRSPRDDRDRAVRLAREGRFDEALPILRRLHREAPHNVPLRADLAAVLAWAGEDREALELGRDLPLAEVEAFVPEALGRSARNLGRTELAVSLYSAVLRQDEGRVESHIGLTLATLESGDVAGAEAHLGEARSRFPNHPELLMASGHVLRAGKRPLEAALLFRQAGDGGADPAEARRLEVLSLMDGGAVFLATERMREGWEVFDGGERGRVLAARGARAVQWSVATPPTPDPGIRFDAVDRALAQLDSALAVVDLADGFPHGQLRFDRIVALRERVRMGEVVAELEALERDGVEVPAYVQRVAGDAHLYLRNPREAEARYRAALVGWPGHPESQIGLFYALLEQERHSEAREIILDLVREQPERRTAEGLREALPNPDRLAAGIAKRLGQAFGADLRGAQEGLEELSGRAPLNLDIRQELVWIYRWRGWPRLAFEEQARILALDPHHVGGRIIRASALLDLGDRSAARATLDTLLVLAPENQHVQRAAESFRVRGLWELSTESRFGRSTGGDLGTRDHLLATQLTTPPMGDRLRLFARWRRSAASFPDLRGQHERVAAGALLQGRGISLSGEVSGDRRGLGRLGGGGNVDLGLGDRWSLSLQGNSYSHEVPHQAGPETIDGWTTGAGIGRRASDRRWWRVDAAYLEMSDGNRRWSGYSVLEQELSRRPMGRLSGILELYGARNSRVEAPYFNPSRILSGLTTAQWEWVVWRSYESSFTQRLRATGGHLWQEGFDHRTHYSGEYAHTWMLWERFDLNYGVHWGRPVFDGRRERRTSLHTDLTWRLPR